MMNLIQPMSLPAATPNAVLDSGEQDSLKYEFLHEFSDDCWSANTRQRQATAFTRAERRKQRGTIRE